MSSTSPALVTVVITSFNSAPFIRDAIESVFAQSYQPIEILVVDGASTDGTVDILRSYGTRLRFISEPDDGEVYALQKGYEQARGKYVNFLNSDDMLRPDTIRDAVAAFEQDPKLAMVFGDALYCSEDGKQIIGRKDTSLMTFEYLLTINPDLTSQNTAIFRLSALQEINGWDVRWRLVNDLDLWLRVLKRFPYRHIAAEWAVTRHHAGQQSSRNLGRMAWDSFRDRRLHGAPLFCPANIRGLRVYVRMRLKRWFGR